jgi:tetratricopeptide (TPR) repeat protein
MFELLLQADRALADGLLDQAERTYWQLIDLDPTNAIAVAGLARVALERGNERAARDFADRALGIDPDSIAARRVLETLTHTGPERAGPEPEALPLLAVERLEALSRRRGTPGNGAEEAGAPNRGGANSGATKARAEARLVTPAGGAAGKRAGTRPAAPAKLTPAKPAAAGSRVPAPADKESRGRTRPDQIGPLPSEPLRERRKTGRLAAAAAAAAAAAHEPLRSRHEPHHAMPIGRRFFGPEGLKAPVADDFSAAEMAAAVEAVGALDEPGVVEAMIASRPAPTGQRGFGDQADLLGAVDATAADESIALRVALVADSVDLEAAEREAARVVDEEASDAFEAAEAIASSALHAWDKTPVVTRPKVAETDADEFEAVEVEAAGLLADEPGVGGSLEFADADAAEAAAVAEAVQEVADAAAMEPETAPAPAPARKSFRHPGGEEPSEEEAESQALREALALVLQGDGQAEDDEVPASRRGAAGPIGAALGAGAAAEPAPTAEPAAVAAPGAEPAPVAETPDSTEANPEAAPRKGIFRRIRGS